MKGFLETSLILRPLHVRQMKVILNNRKDLIINFSGIYKDVADNQLDPK